MATILRAVQHVVLGVTRELAAQRFAGRSSEGLKVNVCADIESLDKLSRSLKITTRLSALRSDSAAVEPTQRAMTRLGKQYEAVVYPKARTPFVVFQDIGQNNRAVADAWPRTIQFFRRHLN